MNAFVIPHHAELRANSMALGQNSFRFRFRLTPILYRKDLVVLDLPLT